MIFLFAFLALMAVIILAGIYNVLVGIYRKLAFDIICMRDVDRAKVCRDNLGKKLGG